MTLRHRGYVLAAGLLGLAACSSDKTTGVGSVSGSVSFTYTGAGGGNYSATGAIASNASSNTAHTTTWAAGFKDNSDNSTNVAANIPRANSKADLFLLTIARQTVGSSDVDANCTGTTTTACTNIFLIVGGDANGDTFSWLCLLDAGTVNITSISATNAQGTFSGTGTCSTMTGETSAWTVSGGSFNVPLLSTNSVP